MTGTGGGRLDMSGQWDGVYSYPGSVGPTTPFLARIEETAGTLSGSIIEPHNIGGGTANATLSGYRWGSSVDFIKSYHGAGPEYAEPVVYSGRLSADALTISGSWMLQELSGTFEMHRDEASVERVEREEAVPVVIG